MLNRQILYYVIQKIITKNKNNIFLSNYKITLILLFEIGPKLFIIYYFETDILIENIDDRFEQYL